jgi:hypothetical protein
MDKSNKSECGEVWSGFFLCCYNVKDLEDWVVDAVLILFGGYS